MAEEVVRDLHGQEELDAALKITNALFRGKLQDLDDEQRRDAVKSMPKIQTQAMKLEDLLVSSNIAKSKREAREWIKGNSIAINGEKYTDPNMIVDSSMAYVDNVLILRKGKRTILHLSLSLMLINSQTHVALVEILLNLN